MAENFQDLKTETDIQEAQTVPNKMNPKGPTSTHIIKMAKVKDKERILKAAREKHSHIKGNRYEAIR